MVESDYIVLLYKRMSGSITKQEAQLLDDWLAGEGKDEPNRLERILHAVDQYPSDYEPDVEKGLARFEDRLLEEPKVAKVVPLASKPRLGWRIAAAVVLLMVMGWLLRISLANNTENLELVSKEVLLQQQLPDGTEVWLRPGSRLTYPERFEGRQRTVQLQGEAYFDVVHNPAQPFLVQTANSTIKVLGTAFDVQAYANQSYEFVQVFEGKVEFRVPAAQKVALLEKGTGAIYHLEKNQLEALATVDENKIAWKTGKLHLRDVTLSYVIGLIEDHFGIHLIAETLEDRVVNCEFTIALDGFDLEKTLALLERIFDFDIERESDTTYRISGGTCDHNQQYSE